MPPVPVTVRKVARDDWVDGYHLPRGTLLAIAVCPPYPTLEFPLICTFRSAPSTRILEYGVPTPMNSNHRAGKTSHRATTLPFLFFHLLLAPTLVLGERWRYWRWKLLLRMFLPCTIYMCCLTKALWPQCSHSALWVLASLRRTESQADGCHYHECAVSRVNGYIY